MQKPCYTTCIPQNEENKLSVVVAPEFFFEEGIEGAKCNSERAKTQKFCRKWLILAIFFFWLGALTGGGSKLSHAPPFDAATGFQVFYETSFDIILYPQHDCFLSLIINTFTASLFLPRFNLLFWNRFYRLNLWNLFWNLFCNRKCAVWNWGIVTTLNTNAFSSLSRSEDHN